MVEKGLKGMEWCEELYSGTDMGSLLRRIARTAAVALVLCLLSVAVCAEPLEEAEGIAGIILPGSGRICGNTIAADRAVALSDIAVPELPAEVSGDVQNQNIAAEIAVDVPGEAEKDLSGEKAAGARNIPAADLPAGVPDAPGADLPSDITDLPAADLPGADIPSDVPDAPGADLPSDVPDLPGTDIPSDVPDAPGTDIPSDAPDAPGADIPSDVPDVPASDSGENVLPDTPVDTEPGGAGTDPEHAGAVNVGGFLVSESGMICGIADVDTAVVDGYMELPSEGCSGIARGAFAGAAAEISEVYIPANITYAEEGAFLGTDAMLWFETEASGGSLFASDGVLYADDGACLLAFPAGRVGFFLLPSHVERLADDAFAGTMLEMVDARKGNVTDTGNLPADKIML